MTGGKGRRMVQAGKTCHWTWWDQSGDTAGAEEVGIQGVCKNGRAQSPPEACRAFPPASGGT